MITKSISSELEKFFASHEIVLDNGETIIIGNIDGYMFSSDGNSYVEFSDVEGENYTVWDDEEGTIKDSYGEKVGTWPMFSLFLN